MKKAGIPKKKSTKNVQKNIYIESEYIFFSSFLYTFYIYWRNSSLKRISQPLKTSFLNKHRNRQTPRTSLRSEKPAEYEKTTFQKNRQYAKTGHSPKPAVRKNSRHPQKKFRNFMFPWQFYIDLRNSRFCWPHRSRDDGQADRRSYFNILVKL